MDTTAAPLPFITMIPLPPGTHSGAGKAWLLSNLGPRQLHHRAEREAGRHSLQQGKSVRSSDHFQHSLQSSPDFPNVHSGEINTGALPLWELTEQGARPT